MLKKFSLIALAFIGIAALIGCNSDADIYNTAITYNSTQVKSFKLENNKKVLASLDTVFFSIDLVNARIFNADSLPYGTKVDKLVVKIGTDNCSTVELTMPSSTGGDTIVNYLTNSTDSINFTRGPVMLRVVSYDGKAERKYSINVNVHQIVPDSLYWDRLAVRALPGNLAAPTAQKTVKLNPDCTITLTTDGTDYCIAQTGVIDGPQPAYTPDFGFTPDIPSLNVADNTLYILSTDGDLYKSTDYGRTWSPTGQTWTRILGAYDNTLLGLRAGTSSLSHVSYPAAAETAADKDFPVDGASNMVTLSTRWSLRPQTIIAGGRKADGSLSKAVWGYDGNTWMKLSDALPVPIEDASLISYTLSKTDTITWTTKNVPALLIIGGRTDNGISDKTYVSRDMGLTWKTGDQLITLPDYIAPRYGAQAIIEEQTFTRSDSEWTDYDSRPLPGWWSLIDTNPSRAIAPATSWQCPFIHWYGGYDIDGNLYNTVWKGVINRLMFRPLE